MNATATPITALVFDIPASLQNRLAEAATDCRNDSNLHLNLGPFGYHAMVMPPFRFRGEEELAAFVHEIRSQRAVRLPTELGDFVDNDAQHILYFGGREPNLMAAFQELRRICEGFAQRKPSTLHGELMPHCPLGYLKNDPSGEYLNFCRGVFEHVPFPDPLYLDSLLLYRLTAHGWQRDYDWEVTLAPAV
ncbi:MAG: hypothetical protein JWN49_750 [Parcubacteria group bacterium]|nr:hypothetical protein [Parcubacteria group bacterium]